MTLVGDMDKWDLSVVAWGHPSDPRTFSGSSRGLTGALRNRGALRREYSAKRLSPVDALSGAVSLSWRGGRVRREVRRDWMWSEAGHRVLSRRINRVIRQGGDRGPFLQVGTLVDLDADLGPHYTYVDMTIPQAHRAGRFFMDKLSVAGLNEAVGIQGRVLRGAAHTFTLSEWARRSVIDDFGVDPAKVTTVYAGANLCVPQTTKETRSGREILFVGIDWGRKGGPLLAEAFAIVRRRVPDATLRIVGCSPDVSGPGIEVEGFLDRRDPVQFERICRFYLRAACFCLPSLFDPFPIAVIEAASAGLPVVAIDNGSRREAVVDGQTGVLAPEATPEALAQALCRVLGDGERCREMGGAARAHARERFTWELVAERIGRVVACGEGAAKRRDGGGVGAGVAGAV